MRRIADIASKFPVLLLGVALTCTGTAGAAPVKKGPPTDPWARLAWKSQAAGFRVLPVLAITRALDNPDLPAAEKKKLLRLANRMASNPGAIYATRELATRINDPEELRDWDWYAGLADLDRDDKQAAANHFAAVRKADRNYLRARYQLGVMAYNSKRLDDAERLFKEILDAKPSPTADLEDLTKMALGRLWYEQRKFQSAAAVYRTVSRTGQLFPVALFEQSWAFFMAGFPNQALGALHGTESPFFGEQFNPEAPLLRSIILYWMCLYRDSDNALQEFIARHSGPMDQLETFLARQQLNPDSAWELFENLSAGVSGESLGIPRNILLTAATSDRMASLRPALAQTSREAGMLEAGKLEDGTSEEESLKGGNETADARAAANALLGNHFRALRNETGKKFIVALGDLRTKYDQLRAQADFLYVELLTSEKDRILGKQHLGSEKFTGKANAGKRPAGWGRRVIAWAPDNKHEYWWDEVGFYIDPAKASCKK